MSGKILLCALCICAPVVVPAEAQVTPTRPAFVLIDQERVLTGSARGRALLAEEERERERLRLEARGIEQAFEEEERLLTERRKELDAAAFRALADDFDARVVEARRLQDEKASALASDFERRRRQFYVDVAPALVRVMESRGAYAIFDESSVLLSDQSLNITDPVIAEIDRLDGPTAPGASGAAPRPAAEPAVGSGPVPAPERRASDQPQPQPRPTAPLGAER